MLQNSQWNSLWIRISTEILELLIDGKVIKPKYKLDGSHRVVSRKSFTLDPAVP